MDRTAPSLSKVHISQEMKSTFWIKTKWMDKTFLKNEKRTVMKTLQMFKA